MLTYADLVGTAGVALAGASLLWQVNKARRDRPRLDVRASLAWTTVVSSVTDLDEFDLRAQVEAAATSHVQVPRTINVEISNRGGLSVTITQIVVFGPGGRLHDTTSPDLPYRIEGFGYKPLKVEMPKGLEIVRSHELRPSVGRIPSAEEKRAAKTVAPRLAVMYVGTYGRSMTEAEIHVDPTRPTYEILRLQ